MPRLRRHHTPRGLARRLPLHIEAHTPCTPIRPLVLARFLHEHTDDRFTSTLISGLTHGFHIGYSGPRSPLYAKNLRSTLEHADVVDEALSKEMAEHRLSGPYSHAPYPNLRTSGLGVVPKKDGSCMPLICPRGQ